MCLLLESAAAIIGRAANRQMQREEMLSQLSQGREQAMGKPEVVLLSSHPAWYPRWARWKCEGAMDHCPNQAEFLH